MDLPAPMKPVRTSRLEVGGDEGLAGLAGHGFDLGSDLGLFFGLGGRHLPLLDGTENERAATFVGCGSGRSMSLRVFRYFQRGMRGLHWPQGGANS